MKKILFVCHGNICRSPMAEFILKHLAEEAGIRDLDIASAATSAEEIGNPVYPPARRTLAEHGISCEGKRARQLRRRDYEDYDLLIGMDESNLRRMRSLFGGDPDGKLHLLLDWSNRPREVSDPWYTDDFDRAWTDILEGCTCLLAYLQGLDRRSLKIKSESSRSPAEAAPHIDETGKLRYHGGKLRNGG